MNHKLYILLILFVSVLNKSETFIFTDKETKDITVSDEIVYIGMKIEKSGSFSLEIKSENHSFKSGDFFYGLSNDENPPSDLKNDGVFTGGVYTCLFTKEDNQNYIIVKITGLSSGLKMNIKATFYTKKTAIIVIVVVCIVLLLVLAIVCCIFRKFLRCLCCMK